MTEPPGVDLVDLRHVRLGDLPEYAGHPALEAMLERIRRQAEQSRQVASGFSSAI